MVKLLKLIVTGFFLYSIVSFTSSFRKNRKRQQNQPPVVKITAPKNNTVFNPNALVNYSITVSDKEDGDSKYDEINPKEVFLEVKHLPNSSKMPAEASKGVQTDSPGLGIIRTSNCFNCHNFDSRSIGPSFTEISKRYPATTSNVEILVKSIREGSSGVWGKVSMPTHPELTKEQTKTLAEWILITGADPDVIYYTGTEGSFHVKPTAVAGQKAVYVLTATYTDHGLKGTADKNLKGQDVVIIQCK